ncbi:MAG: pyruvate kinase [Thermodesulfobacteriota bacterium]|nr:pyruvate kinase [Thermodesulfobacteriota bacterium]
MRRTKIVCTVGPASASEALLSKMIDAGMDVARLNFSHGDHISHGELIQRIRLLAEREQKPVAILQDLCGPKIRLGILPETGVRLIRGTSVTLCVSELAPEGTLPVDYPNLHLDVKVGDSIMIADGLMELRIEAIDAPLVKCVVVTGGIAYSRKGVNLPSSDLSIPAFTEKDRADLLFGLEQGVDIVALSFVRSAADLQEIRTVLDKAESRPQLVAKIEKPQAVENIDEILDQVDGVMIARGDLGVEVPLEQVPVLQKQLIRKARCRGRSVITATQMLSSMVSRPRPTRAEATDVANAIYDGTDALMLSDETASGKYPLQATEVLDRIAKATEPHIGNELNMRKAVQTGLPSVSWAVGHSARGLADDLRAAAIVAYTQSGFTAACVSHFRPECPVIALTPNVQTYRQMNLLWGVTPVLIEPCSDIDALFVFAGNEVMQRKLAVVGDRIIVTAGTPLWQPGSTNLLKMIELT